MRNHKHDHNAELTAQHSIVANWCRFNMYTYWTETHTELSTMVNFSWTRLFNIAYSRMSKHWVVILTEQTMPNAQGWLQCFWGRPWGRCTRKDLETTLDSWLLAEDLCICSCTPVLLYAVSLQTKIMNRKKNSPSRIGYYVCTNVKFYSIDFTGGGVLYIIPSIKWK